MLITKLISDVSGLSIPEETRNDLLITCEALRQELDHLNSVSESDSLGDWPNRRGLFRQANRIFSEFDRDVYTSVSVAFIDLDKFKSINDTYGHKHGDEVIIRVAEIIHSSIRKIDIYGRLSGDEFIVVLPGSTEGIAEKILTRIKNKFCSTNFSFNTAKLPVSLTFGIVSTEVTNEKTFEGLLHKADEMMNAQKGDRSRQ
jgi:diguanylate cyclase (GGDEF)-like protein